MNNKRHRTIFLVFIGLFLMNCEGNSQSSTKVKTNDIATVKNVLDSLLQSERANELLSNYLSHSAYQFQIIYTQINRDSSNQAHLNTFEYQVNEDVYFYPASTVKLPLTLLALEKLYLAGVDRDTELRSDGSHSGAIAVSGDWTAPNHQASIQHYIKKIFVVSDNDASNRLYDFLGRKYIHETLAEKGYENVQILHRLGIPKEQHGAATNKFTNEVSFFQEGQLLYQQPALEDKSIYDFSNKPTNFQYSNRLPLRNLNQMLTNVLFPKHFSDSCHFTILPSDRKYLLQCMATLPRESEYPNYLSLLKPGEYPPDGYRKYFLFANESQIPAHFRVFSKVGMGFNHLTDAAYIVDFENGVEFILTATIAVPNNQYNDGLIFLKNLGQLMHEYELKRYRSFEPDFEELEGLEFE